MEKQKRWQFYLILAVIILTLYNILPTIFYYSNPLKAPVDEARAEKVAMGIVERVNELEEDSIAWLHSFTKLLGIKANSIALQKDNPGTIHLTFANGDDANLFKRFLPQAGVLIPFVPSQLELYPDSFGTSPNEVFVGRQIDVHLNPKEQKGLFKFSPKRLTTGEISPLYRDIVFDRMTEIALGFGGVSKPALQLSVIAENNTDSTYDELVITLAKEIALINDTFGKDSPITKRYFASFSQTNENGGQLIQKFLGKAESLKIAIASERETLLKEQKRQKEEGVLLSREQDLKLSQLNKDKEALETAISLVQKNLSLFKDGKKPLSEKAIGDALAKSAIKGSTLDKRQVIDLGGRNPFVQAIVVDWGKDKITLRFYKDVEEIRNGKDASENGVFLRDRLNQAIIQDIAYASRFSDESLTPDEETYGVSLNTLINSQSILAIDLSQIATKKVGQLQHQLHEDWTPNHVDLGHDAYPVLSYDDYKKLSDNAQKLGLVVYAPAMYDDAPIPGFKKGSIYVIAKGLDPLIQKYEGISNTNEAKAFSREINLLNSILRQQGFIGYSGASYGMSSTFKKDYIFELSNYYSNLLRATREDFVAKGSKKFATLDFTDVEQRLLTTNKIEDRIQEDLLKWKEEYSAAQVDPSHLNKYAVPAPTKNPYWENFKLSFVKYFRGDDRKILKWGLDLSGGKTVRIGLYDHNHRPVTNPDDLRQAVNELYTRINSMGISERTIRIEGQNIILDFPGSQGLSAADLIQASAMYFHIANEKFSPANADLKKSVNQFLQEVWNEAVVMNRKDIQSINTIAWEHLGGDSGEIGMAHPMSDAAKELYDNGLRLANPKDGSISHAFNDTLSSIAILRGDEFTEWGGQANPLMVVFHNFALEGSSLTNVQVGYDPSQGNILSFNIKSSYDGAQGGSPRDDFYNWTSQFSEDKIIGTPKESYSQGHGWRMAVVLNGKVISSPVLRAALRDGATISGHFSQREINRLAADLKAGSLSFTPHILSEENVSPELGQEERSQGIFAATLALVLVVVAMCGYYHFAGVVASVAVLFNILIMWGVLQNLGAALTLPGIAGIVLTIGMAVDANVLVFERIREEFSLTGRIASAIQAGYRKAFTAIVDSNITTIIAALILIQFDSGPIKGFAVTLIIGILSSMFTSLFMTRYYFAGWVQNPNHKTLKMSQFISHTHFDFLAQAKKAIALSVIVLLLGSFFFIQERKTLFGMDFTGGYSLNIELQEKPEVVSYRREAFDALLAKGATTNDIQIRELSKPNQLRIQLGTGMEEKGHPFYLMPESLKLEKPAYDYLKNPRIVWVMNALQEAGLQVVPSQLPQLDTNWTVISGQLSDAMRNNALIALGLALLSILVYITFRFEFKYAIAAVIGLIHDVLITVGLLAMFHALGFAVQIDLQVIGAIMTIIGYSLNDTIIVFDRIREDLHLMRKSSFRDIINHALNVTLSRTLMTSGTTLLVLLTLVLLGGQSIFAFSLVMTLGVLIGTASSLFIATPVLLYFHNRELEAKQKGHLKNA